VFCADYALFLSSIFPVKTIRGGVVARIALGGFAPKAPVVDCSS
jgi:hypothetical protein